VIQEYAYDHPFHNGAFVAQYPVQVGERVGNFWVTPPRRGFHDPVYAKVGRVDAAMPPTVGISGEVITFTVNSVWRDENEEPLIDEVRTVSFRALEDATVCDMASRKVAAYGAVEFGKTKFGSIGARVEPRLLPSLGGQIIGCLDGELHRGTADEVANDKACDAVAYENDVAGVGVYGLCLMILDNSASSDRRGPWFIRDYGLAMFNATRNASIVVPAGNAWTATLRVIAYDGALSAARLAAWKECP
jgi:hypothetical protein